MSAAKKGNSYNHCSVKNKMNKNQDNENNENTNPIPNESTG